MCFHLSLAGFALFVYTVTRCHERHHEPHSNQPWKFVHRGLLSMTNVSTPGTWKVDDQTMNITFLCIDQYFHISLLIPAQPWIRILKIQVSTELRFKNTDHMLQLHWCVNFFFYNRHSIEFIQVYSAVHVDDTLRKQRNVLHVIL